MSETALPLDGKIVTFDIQEWQSYSDTVFKEEDFSDKRLIHYVADLSLEPTIDYYSSLLTEAEIIFIDATHDGVLEEKLLANLKKYLSKIRFLFLWTIFGYGRC